MKDETLLIVVMKQFFIFNDLFLKFGQFHGNGITIQSPI